MLQLLAQAAVDTATATDPDTMLSGKWVLALVSTIIGGLLGLAGKGAIQKIKVSPSPMIVSEHRDPTWAEVAELERRMAAVESEQRRLRDEMVNQYKEITLSAEKRASRLMGELTKECKELRESFTNQINDLSKQLYLMVGSQKKP